MVVSFLGCKNNDQNLVQLITFDEFETVSKINGVQLIDVRTPEEYSDGIF